MTRFLFPVWARCFNQSHLTGTPGSVAVRVGSVVPRARIVVVVVDVEGGHGVVVADQIRMISFDT